MAFQNYLKVYAALVKISQIFVVNSAAHRPTVRQMMSYKFPSVTPLLI